MDSVSDVGNASFAHFRIADATSLPPLRPIDLSKIKQKAESFCVSNIV